MWWLKSELCCHWQHGTKNDQFIMLACTERSEMWRSARAGMWWLKSELCCHWQHGTKNDQFIMLACTE
ncbi:hypothetical protein IH92_14390 [Salmonella enterica]|nr:hypothetical protein [Salmonella enterica]